MARLRAGHARPLRNVIKWDVGRPDPRPPGRFAAMRSRAVCRGRGRRPRRPAKGQGFPPTERTTKGARRAACPQAAADVSGGGRCAGGMNPSPTGYLLAGVGRKVAEGSKPLPTGQKIKGWQWRGSVNGLRTRGAREGGSPPLCSGRRLPGTGWRRKARRNPPVT